MFRLRVLPTEQRSIGTSRLAGAHLSAKHELHQCLKPMTPKAEASSGPHLLPERLVSAMRPFSRAGLRGSMIASNIWPRPDRHPRILLIGCCDSRVSPEVIFDAGPGEIFVVRNVANLVPPYGPNDDLHGTSAALEYAVLGLRVEHIVVLGHARCGGVRAYAESDLDPYQKPLSAGDFIGKWISLIAPAAAKIGRRRCLSMIFRTFGAGFNHSRSRKSAYLSLCRDAREARHAASARRLFRHSGRKASGARRGYRPFRAGLRKRSRCSHSRPAVLTLAIRSAVKKAPVRPL